MCRVLVGSSRRGFLGRGALGVTVSPISLPRQQVEGGSIGKLQNAILQTSSGLCWPGEGRVGWWWVLG